MTSLDTRSLRQTIRFIHCIQKERGSTCATAAALQPSQIGLLIEENLRQNQGNENYGRVSSMNTHKNHKMMIQVMCCTRQKTDLALTDILNSHASTSSIRKNATSFRTSLDRIRSMIVSDSLKKYGAKLPQTVYKNSSTANYRRIFMAFNALVVHIIHEIFVITSFNQNFSPCRMNPKFVGGNRDRADSSPIRPKHKNMDARTLHDGTNSFLVSGKDKESKIPLGTLSNAKHVRMVASADGSFYDHIFQSVQIGTMGKGLASQPTKSSLFAPSKKSSAYKPPLPTSATRVRAFSEEDHRNKEKSASKRNESRSKALLSLLLSFVQLKESTSIERAFLSSLLSMSGTSPTLREGLEDLKDNDDEELLTEIKIAKHRPLRRRRLSDEGEKIFNDLVMELENQHLMIKKLRKKAREVEDNDKNEGHRWSISALVEQSVQISPELAELHNLVRQNFDLQAFSESITMEKFWTTITNFIDRLHALELLIIEEIESCTFNPPVQQYRSISATAAITIDDLVPVSLPETAPSPAQSITSSGGSYIDQEGPVYDRSLLLSALNTDKNKKFDIASDEARKVLQAMTPGQLKHCILSMFSAPPDSPPEDDSFCLSDDGSFITEIPNQPEMQPIIPSVVEIKEKTVKESPDQDWLIDLYQVSFMKRIGRGCAGTTYIGKWQNQPVAVKVAAMTDMGIEGWGTEMRSLQRLHHPNIIRFYGAIYNDHPCTHCLVLEYCNCGDLSVTLKMKQLPPNFFERTTSDMANGMSYLHSKNILHRDIKPANILIHGDLRAGDFMVKLTDFGLATLNKSDEDEHTAETGTYRWMAPEVIRHEPYSYQADVYSFSIVVWQLLTREAPFLGFTQVEAASMVALNHARPPFPPNIPNYIEALIAEGWHENPKARPSFETIAKQMESFKDHLTLDEIKWIEDPEGHQVYVPRPPPIVRTTVPAHASKAKSFFFKKKKK